MVKGIARVPEACAQDRAFFVARGAIGLNLTDQTDWADQTWPTCFPQVGGDGGSLTPGEGVVVFWRTCAQVQWPFLWARDLLYSRRFPAVGRLCLLY